MKMVVKKKNGVNLITPKKVELIKEYGCFLIKERFFRCIEMHNYTNCVEAVLEKFYSFKL